MCPLSMARKRGAEGATRRTEREEDSGEGRRGGVGGERMEQ